ncbi:CASP-like protein [Abeliophyllum distichum]|uniref:CASP-like protein n=1 Tax=Abeliophyllum distichum TaxID=126358 RepID=A0ABD1PN52_9LAMI
MENPDPSNHNKKILRRSSNSHISISDNESTTSQVDSFHSPLRSESPLRSDDPCFQTESVNFSNKNNKSSEAVDKYYSAVPSPRNPNLKAVSPVSGDKERKPWPHSEKPTSENLDLSSMPVVAGGKGQGPYLPQSENLNFQSKGGMRTSPVLVYNMSVKEESAPGVTKVGQVEGDIGGMEERYGSRAEEAGRERRSRAAVGSTWKRSRMDLNLEIAALGLRAFELIVCLVSFSVMAADRTQGWSGDSFDRYKEYRYCLTMNVIGFVYSGFQACDLAYRLTTGKYVISHHLRYHFDFSMDQILAYLLMSASSSAATRVDDWISNWGKDEFTLMASASIAMSFLAFVAFALSSLVSGYNLCCHDST